MPWVSLAQYDDKKTDIVESDGERGYLIKQHWTAWVPFWICAPLVTVLGIGGLVAAKQLKWLPPSNGWGLVWQIAIAGAVVVAVLKVDLLWYWKLSKTYILVTECNVFTSAMEKVFVNVMNAYSLDESTITTHAASLLLPSVRSVELRIEGQMIVKMPRAAGGDEIKHAIDTLRGAK